MGSFVWFPDFLFVISVSWLPSCSSSDMSVLSSGVAFILISVFWSIPKTSRYGISLIALWMVMFFYMPVLLVLNIMLWGQLGSPFVCWLSFLWVSCFFCLLSPVFEVFVVHYVLVLFHAYHRIDTFACFWILSRCQCGGSREIQKSKNTSWSFCNTSSAVCLCKAYSQEYFVWWSVAWSTHWCCFSGEEHFTFRKSIRSTWTCTDWFCYRSFLVICHALLLGM